jgi:hypothetical protein
MAQLTPRVRRAIQNGDHGGGVYFRVTCGHKILYCSGKDPQPLEKIKISWQQALAVILAFVSVAELVKFNLVIAYPIRIPRGPFIADSFVAATLLFAGAAVAGWAAWCIWNEKPWARLWAFAGSAMMLLTFFRHFIHNAFFPPISGLRLGPALVPGILGLTICVLWHTPPRYCSIFEWLYHREELDPPALFDAEKKDS